MGLLKEISSTGFTEGALTPSLHCKVYEDNGGELDKAREYKYCPRNKLLNVKLHHFRDYVDRREINIHKIRTEDQQSDYLTKSMDEKTHVNHMKNVQV